MYTGGSNAPRSERQGADTIAWLSMIEDEEAEPLKGMLLFDRQAKINKWPNKLWNKPYR